METSLASALRAFAFVEGDSVLLHFFARDLGSAAALHGLVGFLSFAIVVQTGNVLNRNSALLIQALLFKAWCHWNPFNSWTIVGVGITDNLHQPDLLDLMKHESCSMRNKSMSL